MVKLILTIQIQKLLLEPQWLSKAFFMFMTIIHTYFSASCEMLDKADAVLTSVKTKSVDSNLDFIEEEAEYDSKRSYEDL